MGIKALVGDEGPEVSLVQNRLTVAAAVLATLFFAGTFSMALNNQFPSDLKRDYRIEFTYLAVTITLGALLTLSAIAGLLTCQQIRGDGRGWLGSKRSWFVLSSCLLYLALTQAMSAGLTEVVYGVHFRSQRLADFLGWVATLVWVLLLLVCPVHALRSGWRFLSGAERTVCSVGYALGLAGVLGCNAAIYLIQNGSTITAPSYLSALLDQLLQPSMWSTPWDPGS